jgi:hypothetical protein
VYWAHGPAPAEAFCVALMIWPATGDRPRAQGDGELNDDGNLSPHGAPASCSASSVEIIGDGHVGNHWLRSAGLMPISIAMDAIVARCASIDAANSAAPPGLTS